MDNLSTFSPPVDSGIHFSGFNFLQILRGNRLKPLHCLDLIFYKSTTSVSTFLDDFPANFEGKSPEALALSGFIFRQINYVDIHFSGYFPTNFEGKSSEALAVSGFNFLQINYEGKGRPINAIRRGKGFRKSPQGAW